MTTHTVTRQHRSEYPQPITFDAGTVLAVGERYDGDEGWEGWYSCLAPGQERGWVPEQVLEFVGPGTARAREPYTARELDVDVGDVLESSRTLNGWAWCVRPGDDASEWVPLANLRV